MNPRNHRRSELSAEGPRDTGTARASSAFHRKVPGTCRNVPCGRREAGSVETGPLSRDRQPWGSISGGVS